MEPKSSVGRNTAVLVVVALLIAATAFVGVYALHARQGRQLQLHDDEVGRQRDEVLNAARAAKPHPPGDATELKSAHGPDAGPPTTR